MGPPYTGPPYAGPPYMGSPYTGGVPPTSTGGGISAAKQAVEISRNAIPRNHLIIPPSLIKSSSPDGGAGLGVLGSKQQSMSASGGKACGRSMMIGGYNVSFCGRIASRLPHR